MSRAVRFPFATDFAAITGGAIALSPVEIDHHLAEREAAGYARGFDDGACAERALASARLSEAVAAIAQDWQRMEQEQARHHAAMEADVARLALAFARKLAGHLIAAVPTAPLEQAIRAVLADMTAAPHIRLAVHPDLAAPMRDILGALIGGRHPCPVIEVRGDPALPPGDGRLDWDGGGLISDAAALDRRLAALIDQTCPVPRSADKDMNHEPA